jgi:hypothetical protein
MEILSCMQRSEELLHIQYIIHATEDDQCNVEVFLDLMINSRCIMDLQIKLANDITYNEI